MEKYFVPYFDIMKNCGTTTDKGCFYSSNEIKYLNGTVNTNNYNTNYYYRFIGSDGMLWRIWRDNFTDSARMASIYVDVNGKKSPNTVGRDIFLFSLFPNKGIVPFGLYDQNDDNIVLTTEQRDGTGQFGCNTTLATGVNYGENCAAKVLSENAMNY
jgi:hypothetical protein